MIELSAQTAVQPQESSREHNPLLEMLTGSGKAKTAKSKDKQGSFAALVKTLLEGIKNRSPELAEGQIQPENTEVALKSDKNQGRKPGPATIIPQDKDGLGFLKAKNLSPSGKNDETDVQVEVFLSKNEGKDVNAWVLASFRPEGEVKNLPLPVEEGDFSQKDQIHSLADMVRPRKNADPRLASETGDTVERAGLSSAREPRVGLVDLNKAEKTGETRDRRRERLARGTEAQSRFEIRDFRSAPEYRAVGGTGNDGGLSARQEVPESELVVLLDRFPDREGEGASAPPSQFRDVLAQELRGALGQDIVRHASMILKDGGEGLIRLSLKPESLGNVKIRLELSENKIAGHIIVENSDALRAFERELPVLEAAFRDSGFDGATLELAQNGGEGGQRNREDASPFYSERFVASSYEALTDSLSGKSEALVRANTRVNMLA